MFSGLAQMTTLFRKVEFRDSGAAHPPMLLTAEVGDGSILNTGSWDVASCSILGPLLTGRSFFPIG